MNLECEILDVINKTLQNLVDRLSEEEKKGDQPEDKND